MFRPRNKTPSRGSAVFASETSIPDKLSAALKSLRPGALAQSASSSAPFKHKVGFREPSLADSRVWVVMEMVNGSESLQNGAAVNADDVVFIPSTDHKHRFSPNQVNLTLVPLEIQHCVPEAAKEGSQHLPAKLSLSVRHLPSRSSVRGSSSEGSRADPSSLQELPECLVHG